MKKIIAAGILLSLFIFVANLPGAVPKWEQLPNCVDGFNVLSYHLDPPGLPYMIVADDFQCNDPRPITHLQWWGSFEDYLPTDPEPVEPPPLPFLPVSFDISWHEYTHPDGSYSQPDTLMQVELCEIFTVSHWCTHPCWNNQSFYEHEYLFECDLVEPFPQIDGQYYFINIVANYIGPEPPVNPWGWKNSEEHWNDDAVVSEYGGEDGTWVELTWPEEHRLYGSMDMAFRLFVDTTPTPSSTPTPPPTRTPTPSPWWTTAPPPTRTPTPPPTTTPTPRASMTMTPPPTPTPVKLPWIYDYNGDGISDIAIFRDGTGLWSIRGISRVYFGTLNDEPVPGDYNGDGTTDIAIFRSATSLWAVRTVSNSYFGSSSDNPFPGDYDGDGTWDLGVFRGSSGLWALKGISRVYFGSSGDSPVSGYYDGDGTRDIALFRSSSGLWAIRNISRIYFGVSGDQVVPGGYDGSGAWQAGVFRPASGLWAIRGETRVYFGTLNDEPVPGDYNGNGVDGIGLFRDSTGLWAIRGLTRVYYGTSGDEAVSR